MTRVRSTATLSAVDRLVTVVRWTLVVAGGAAAAPVVATLLLRQIADRHAVGGRLRRRLAVRPVAGLAALALFVLARSWTGVVGRRRADRRPARHPGPAVPRRRPRRRAATTELTVMTVNLHFGLGDAGTSSDRAARTASSCWPSQELDHGALAAMAAAGSTTCCRTP